MKLASKVCMTISLIMLASALLYRFFTIQPKTYVVDEEGRVGQSNTWDFRFRFIMNGENIYCKWVNMTILYMGQPLANTTIFLFTDKMVLIDKTVTNETGKARLYAPLKQMYIIKAEYWAEFQLGGVEIVRHWFLFNGGGDDTLQITVNWAPAIWSDEPTIPK